MSILSETELKLIKEHLPPDHLELLKRNTSISLSSVRRFLTRKSIHKKNLNILYAECMRLIAIEKEYQKERFEQLKLLCGNKTDVEKKDPLL